MSTGAIAKALVLGSFDDDEYSTIKWFIGLFQSMKIDTLFLKDEPSIKVPLTRIQDEIRNSDIVVVVGLHTSKWDGRLSDYLNQEIGMTVAFNKPLLIFHESNVDISGWVEQATQFVPFSKRNLKRYVQRFVSAIFYVVYDIAVPTNRLFGRKSDRSCPVTPVGREVAEKKTHEIIKRAQFSIRNISIHGITYAPNTILRLDDSIDIRVLLLNCKSQGYDLIHTSPYDIPDFTDLKLFSVRYKIWYDMALKQQRDIIRCYSTVPWFRGTVVDGNRAVFLMTPNLCYGSDVQLWYTEDVETCKRLVAIFDDIWEDKRTISLKELVKRYPDLI